MNRTEFLSKLVRFLLFGLIAGVIAITGKRAVSGSGCSACPGKGICSGKQDCNLFLSEKK